MTDGRKAKTQALKMHESVHDQAFYLWYKMGKPGYAAVRKAMTDAGVVRIPTTTTLGSWCKNDAWDMRADALDGQIEMSQDGEIIKQRQDIIKHMADVGKDLVDMGMKYLQVNGLENSADAIRAIGKGAELQDKLLGWAAVFAELSTAKDDDLDRMLKKYMTGDVLEAQAIDATEPTDDKE
jgi:hypothetical protein